MTDDRPTTLEHSDTDPMPEPLVTHGERHCIVPPDSRRCILPPAPSYVALPQGGAE